MQFQRDRRDKDSYPRLVGHWPDLDTDGNIYISGYGFVHLDPFQLERHELKRSASIAGTVMLMRLLIPMLLIIPAQIFVQKIAHWLLANAPDNLVVWNAVLIQFRTDICTYGSLLIPMIFLMIVGGSDIKKRSNTAFKLSTAVLSIGICLGLSSLIEVSGTWFTNICSFFGLTVPTSDSIPSIPAAQLLYFLRTGFVSVLLEEILLRGMLMRVLRKHGDAFALMLTSIVSGLITGSIGNGLGAFLMALMYGYITLRTGSTVVAIVSHIFCALWPELNQMVFSGDQVAKSTTCILLIAIGIICFAIICLNDYNAFILSGQSLDYARLSGQKPVKSRLTFKSKLAAAMTSSIFSVTAFLWIIRAVSKLISL